MMHRSLRAALWVALPLATGACLDGPFARVNPNDPSAPITMEIVGGKDTLRSEGEGVLYQLVTTPAREGYTALWTSDHPDRLIPSGLGRFVVGPLPNIPLTVTISAIVGGNTVQRQVVILAAP